MNNFGKKQISIFIVIVILFSGVFYIIYNKEKLSPQEIETSRVISILEEEGLLNDNKVKSCKIVYNSIDGFQADGELIIKYTLEKDTNANLKLEKNKKLSENKYIEKDYSTFLKQIDIYKKSNIINEEILKKLNDYEFLNINNKYKIKEHKSETDDNNFLINYYQTEDYLLFISRI